MEPLDKKMIPMVQHQTIPSNMKKSPRRQHELRDIFQGSGFIEPGAGSAEPTRRRGDVIQGDIKVIPELDKAAPKIAESTAPGKVFPKVEVGVGWDDAPSPSGNEGEGSGHSVLGHKTTPQPDAGNVFPKVEMMEQRGDVGVIGDTGLFKKWGDPVLRTPDGDIKPVPALSGERGHEKPYGEVGYWKHPATEGNYWKHPATGEEGIVIINTQPATEGEAFPRVETEAGLKSRGLMDGGSFGLDGKGDDLGAGGL